MANGQAGHVNFDDWARGYRGAVKRYQSTHSPDDYTEAEEQRLKLTVRYTNHRDEINASLEGHPDRATLEAIRDNLTERIHQIAEPTTRHHR